MSATFLYGANVQANGIRQHFLRYGGKGKPLILVPGITSPAITWGFVADRLAATHDVYVLDVRGRGLSETGDQLSYSLDTYAQDVSAFAAALGIQDYILMGHSMGARIAIRLGRLMPQGCSRLVLIDPPVSGPGRRRYPADLSWYIDSIRLAKKGIDLDAMRSFCPTWTDEQLRLRAEWLHTCNEEAIRKTYAGFHEDNIHADLAEISLPALLMAAARGDVILPEDEAEILKIMPSLQFVRVPDAGHMIPWDNLPGFLDAMAGFV